VSRSFYLVSYDIADPKRLRLVARVVEGYGHRVQFSVFECSLDDTHVEQLKAALLPVLNTEEDQVLIICLGPESEQTVRRYDSLGKPYRMAPRVTII